MFRHYLTVAVRNLLKGRIYTAINLLSLSVAITCAVALSLYVSDQLSFDRHHDDPDSIVRVVNEITTNGQSNSYALTSRALGPLLSREYPQVGTFMRVRNFAIPRAVFRHEEVAKYWDNVKIADPAIFDVFAHEVVHGQLAGALDDPSSIAVSESFASSYFPDEDPIGKTVSTDTFNYRITAVFKDLPRNSHIRYDALISTMRLRDFGMDDATSSPEQLFDIENYTYFKLAPGTSRAYFDQLLSTFGKEVAEPVGRRMQSQIRFISQPLTDIHFDTRHRYDQPVSNILYIYGFIAVALFLVVVACINYTNLATARAIRRSKEIGMRRVIGATRSQLITQFLAESVCLALVAALIAIVILVAVDMTVGIGSVLGAESELRLFDRPGTLLKVLVGTIAIGVAAGLYPAFYLSSISAQAAISNQRQMRKSSFSLREALVLIQFVVSIGIVASTLIMHGQLNYIAEKPLGFQRENKVAVLLRGVEVIGKFAVMKTELERHADIASVTESSFVPGDEVPAFLMMAEDNDGAMQEVTINQIAVGRDFVENAGIGMAAGRNFSQRMLTDLGASVLVNESFVRFMGWEDAIGKRVQGDGRVIGVVKDFHFSSLHSPVGPALIRQFRPNELESVPPTQRALITRSMIVDITGDDVTDALAEIQRVVTTLDPRNPFEYTFFEDLLAQQYASETRIMHLTGKLAVICIVISCLGLFGLAALATEQRTKEIGIRKVLGASYANIILMLSKGLLLLVLIAAVAASLITWFVMRQWTASFAYRDEFHLGVFIAATVLMGSLAFLSVAIQAARATLQNPVNSLRYE